ncbi:hypothetical protein BKA62DRAFT_683813 [Auriculariales sp. MPI-PUGE-AT-0066]|nr:hypothetical protein BKA62DRAFT_683813 [Auriculariales sp. MPI-PUGE-AT-0066]
MKPLLVGLLVTLVAIVDARFAGVQDVDAFPKYGITFLNALPVANETVQEWLHRGGVTGGEPEFLGSKAHRHILGSELSQPNEQEPVQLMRFGAASYACLIPRPQHIPHASEEHEPAPEPSKTWELLQPLSGRCLYHRQGWFTYSYCHGQHVRQFRELQEQTFTFPPVAKVPEEDPEFPAYTLGRSPQAEDGSLKENENRLELARGTGQRYLHFHWGDGTECDRTGKRRGIEVQFHCSTTVTDTIVFVKETQTCEYTLVIHTSRLCSEPGFRRVLDDLPAQQIQCREVVPDGSQPAVKSIPAPPHEPTGASEADVGQHKPQRQENPLGASPHPEQFTPRQITRLPVKQPSTESAKGATKKGEAPDAESTLRKLIESVIAAQLKSANDKETKTGRGHAAPKSDDQSDSAAPTDKEQLAAILEGVQVYNAQRRKLKTGETVLQLEVDEDVLGNEVDGLYDDYADDDFADDEDVTPGQGGGETKLTLADALRATGPWP